jgi:DNA-binding response OmpR family regulator
VHVGHLRSKLGVEDKRIETVSQVGYKLVPPKK